MRSIIVCTALLLFISLLPVTYSQQSTDERFRFAQAVVQQLSDEIAEQENRERLELAQLDAAVQAARQRAQRNAQTRREQRNRDMARARILSSGGDPTVSSRSVMEREIGVMQQRETVRTQEEEDERAELLRLQKLEDEMNRKIDLRENGKMKLQVIQVKIRAWQDNPTDQGWMEISKQITSLSAEQDRGAMVRITTRREGAFIRYQTEGEREDNGPVHPAALSTNNINEPMSYGRYY
ncbi:MAG TPA: hypothetical protein VK619_09385, partial [Pyrinomonadaceae bacterium]|nr:hypothetical protein [Pyrinomonadaceae bacterium]